MSEFEKYYPKISNLSTKLLDNPELGFKEYQTSKLIEDEIKSISPSIKVEHYLGTGLKVIFDNHKPKTIGIIGATILAKARSWAPFSRKNFSICQLKSCSAEPPIWPAAISFSTQCINL